jgi:hypothetical protein
LGTQAIFCKDNQEYSPSAHQPSAHSDSWQGAPDSSAGEDRAGESRGPYCREWTSDRMLVPMAQLLHIVAMHRAAVMVPPSVERPNIGPFRTQTPQTH